MQRIALALMRGLAERDAQVGWAVSPAGLLRYAVRGSAGAQPLLLVHGLGDSLAGWARVAGRLARSFQVHLLDLPGHGLSERPPDWRLGTLAAAVSEYAARLRDPVIVGHSLGGWLALRVALSGAVRPAGIVLINPGGATLPAGGWQPFLEIVSARDARGAARYLERAFHRAPLAMRLFPGEVIRAMSAEACQGPLRAVAEADFLREEELASLRAPVRLVWGARDRLLPEGTLEFFRRALPRAGVVILDRAGHLPHLEAPRELSRALLLPFPA
ncbi:MAG: alpha/beta fold hydrolase [Myxococcales bacterium]